MWEQIIEAAAANGIWTLLFLGLLVYLLNDSKKREEKYTSTITSLTEGLNALEGIKQDIKNIIDAIDSTLKLGESVTKKKATKKNTDDPSASE